LFFLGFVILIVGADKLVDGASSLGVKAKVSPLVIGLTVVALGTSLPELVINVFASANHNSGLALGNIIGSNIANIMLILGVTSIIYPVSVDDISIKRDIPAGFAATIVLLLLANDFFIGTENPYLSLIDGAILLLCFITYMYVMIRTSKSSIEADTTNAIPLPKSILFVILGCAAIYFGGELVSSNASKIAKSLGMSDEIIGLTIVAFATSLPELITSVVAAMKKNIGIVMGNILGSNIINILVILGVSSVINPISNTFGMGLQPLVLLLANILLILFVFTGRGKKISRAEGIIFCLIYTAFITLSVIKI